MKKVQPGFFVILAVVFCMPSVALHAEESNQYAECRKICAGDGLSCVNKCMEQSSKANSESNNNTVVVVEGSGGYEESYDSSTQNHQAKAVEERRELREKKAEHVPHLSKPTTLPHGGFRRR